MHTSVLYPFRQSLLRFLSLSLIYQLLPVARTGVTANQQGMIGKVILIQQVDQVISRHSGRQRPAALYLQQSHKKS